MKIYTNKLPKNNEYVLIFNTNGGWSLKRGFAVTYGEIWMKNISPNEIDFKKAKMFKLKNERKTIDGEISYTQFEINRFSEKKKNKKKC